MRKLTIILLNEMFLNRGDGSTHPPLPQSWPFAPPQMPTDPALWLTPCIELTTFFHNPLTLTPEYCKAVINLNLLQLTSTLASDRQTDPLLCLCAVRLRYPRRGTRSFASLWLMEESETRTATQPYPGQLHGNSMATCLAYHHS